MGREILVHLRHAFQGVINYVFGNKALLTAVARGSIRLFELSSDNCRLLYAGRQMDPLLQSSGLQCCVLDYNRSLLVVDLTREQLCV